ncbi:hypothetical protein SprV_0702282400 [Sparganum proliferum]
MLWDLHTRDLIEKVGGPNEEPNPSQRQNAGETRVWVFMVANFDGRLGYSSPSAEEACDTPTFNSNLSSWNAIVSMPNTSVPSLDGATGTAATADAQTGRPSKRTRDCGTRPSKLSKLLYSKRDKDRSTGGPTANSGRRLETPSFDWHSSNLTVMRSPVLLIPHQSNGDYQETANAVAADLADTPQQRRRHISPTPSRILTPSGNPDGIHLTSLPPRKKSETFNRNDAPSPKITDGYGSGNTYYIINMDSKDRTIGDLSASANTYTTLPPKPAVFPPANDKMTSRMVKFVVPSGKFEATSCIPTTNTTTTTTATAGAISAPYPDSSFV